MADISAPENSVFRPVEPVTPETSPPRFRFAHLTVHENLSHAVFTRIGGTSKPPCESLNVGLRTPDSPSAVYANLERIQNTLRARRLVFLDQIHGNTVLPLHEADLEHLENSPPADGMVTNVPGVGLLIKQADCQAVILYDPKRRVVANIHCGWRGNVANILGVAVRCMTEAFDCEPGHILAGIGPSLGPCCGEFIGYERLFPRSFQAFLVGRNTFDLWALSTRQLLAAGLREEHIAVSGLCTRCRTDLFFSYRAEGQTGRFATVAMLR
jgi:hypothetical protein